MKKIFVLFLILIGLGGCSNNDGDFVLKNFKNSISNIKSYKIEGTMEIFNDEDSFKYNIDVSYKKNNLYKVSLINQDNKYEQIIIKNDNEVYVITPSLNKSFKFESNWPDNSSQAYLLSSIFNDINTYDKVNCKTVKDGYIIKTKVNYPNNENLKYEKIYLDKNLKINKVEVYDENDIVKISVVFNKINKNIKINNSEFELDSYIKEINEEDKCLDQNCEETKTSSSLDNIIYPLYIPSNTYLANSEKVESVNGNRVILTFNGEKNFVLIEEKAVLKEEMEIIPVYGYPLFLGDSIGAAGVNSLSWDSENVSYYLASTDLSKSEMKNIANSLGNNIAVSKQK